MQQPFPQQVMQQPQMQQQTVVQQQPQQKMWQGAGGTQIRNRTMTDTFLDVQEDYILAGVQQRSVTTMTYPDRDMFDQDVIVGSEWDEDLDLRVFMPAKGRLGRWINRKLMPLLKNELMPQSSPSYSEAQRGPGYARPQRVQYQQPQRIAYQQPQQQAQYQPQPPLIQYQQQQQQPNYIAPAQPVKHLTAPPQTQQNLGGNFVTATPQQKLIAGPPLSQVQPQFQQVQPHYYVQ